MSVIFRLINPTMVLLLRNEGPNFCDPLLVSTDEIPSFRSGGNGMRCCNLFRTFGFGG